MQRKAEIHPCWSNKQSQWGWENAQEILQLCHVQFCQKSLKVPELGLRNPELSKERESFSVFSFILIKAGETCQCMVLTSFFRGSQLLVAHPYIQHGAGSLPWRATRLVQESDEYFLCPFSNRSLLQSLPALLSGRHTLLQKQGVSK